jgi:hypothetical protein
MERRCRVKGAEGGPPIGGRAGTGACPYGVVMAGAGRRRAGGKVSKMIKALNLYIFRGVSK